MKPIRVVLRLHHGITQTPQDEMASLPTGHPVEWTNGPNNPYLPVKSVCSRVETAVEKPVAPYCVLLIRYNDHDYGESLSFDDEEFIDDVRSVPSWCWGTTFVPR
jgi:hypothetical protein